MLNSCPVRSIHLAAPIVGSFSERRFELVVSGKDGEIANLHGRLDQAQRETQPRRSLRARRRPMRPSCDRGPMPSGGRGASWHGSGQRGGASEASPVDIPGRGVKTGPISRWKIITLP